MPADTTEVTFTFKEVEDGFEISSKSGTIMACKLGEGQKQVPAGSVMRMHMLGTGNGIEVFEKHIPIEIFWTKLALWKRSPEFVYWMHAADCDDAVPHLLVAAVGPPLRKRARQRGA
jgi:hypothetical protein